MRLGAPVPFDLVNPQDYILDTVKHGYRCVGWPIANPIGCDVQQLLQTELGNHDIMIAEVGAWSNPLSPNRDTRRDAIAYCKSRLALADEVNAACCVNIAGSRGDRWDGPSALDFEPDTFDMIVEVVQEIIDAVKPKRTFYTLETMPHMMPSSLTDYQRLLDAVNRPAFAVHFDPVNMLTSPGVFFNHIGMIQEFVGHFGSKIKCIHLKDAAIVAGFPVAIQECAPGLGVLDLSRVLHVFSSIPHDICILLEHLTTEQAYRDAVLAVRSAAHQGGYIL